MHVPSCVLIHSLRLGNRAHSILHGLYVFFYYIVNPTVFTFPITKFPVLLHAPYLHLYSVFPHGRSSYFEERTFFSSHIITSLFFYSLLSLLFFYPLLFFYSLPSTLFFYSPIPPFISRHPSFRPVPPSLPLRCRLDQALVARSHGNTPQSSSQTRPRYVVLRDFHSQALTILRLGFDRLGRSNRTCHWRHESC